MYTQCPHCHTLFQITAAQLTVAQGRVRCSRCDQAFNALHTLLDELPDAVRELAARPGDAAAAAEAPEQARQPSTERTPADTTAATPEVTTAVDRVDTAVDQAADTAPESADSTATREQAGEGAPVAGSVQPAQDSPDDDADEPRFSITDIDDIHWDGPPISVREAEEADAVEAEQVPAEAAGVEQAPLPTVRDVADASDPAPVKPAVVATEEDLADDTPAAPRKDWLQPLYGLAALLLIGLLPLQYAYFMRNALADVDAARPWLERMCQYAQCELPLRRAPETVELVNRSVVTHPSVGKALLITAAFKNGADFTQAYPVLEVTLSDATNARVAMRRFLPREYLSEGLDLAQGMAPGALVNVVLEVAEPDKHATSYQFEFK